MLIKGDKKTIRAWAMYDWANSAYSLTITSAVFPIFYEFVTSRKDDGGSVVQDFVRDQYDIVNTSLYSYAIAIAFLVTAAIAPLLSGIADYSDNKKRFLQFFCYLGSISCLGLYFFSLSNIWFGIACITFACIGFSGSLIFYNAYLPEIADAKDHDKISAYGFSLGYIGSVLLLVANLAMVLFPDFLPGVDLVEIKHLGFVGEDAITASKTVQAFKISCLSVAIWWAGWAQWTFSKLPNKTYTKKLTNNIIFNGYWEINKVWKELADAVVLKRYLLAFFFYNTGVQTVMYMAANFAAKEIKSKDADGNDTRFESFNLIITILIIQFVAIIGAYLFSYLSKKFGNLKALMIAVLFWSFLVVCAYYVQYDIAFYVLAAGVGLVMGGVQSLSRSTYSKLLPETKDHASYFSFYNMCDYIGTVVGMSFFAFILNWTNDMRSCILIIGSFFVLGLISLLRVPKHKATENA